MLRQAGVRPIFESSACQTNPSKCFRIKSNPKSCLLIKIILLCVVLCLVQEEYLHVLLKNCMALVRPFWRISYRNGHWCLKLQDKGRFKTPNLNFLILEQLKKKLYHNRLIHLCLYKVYCTSIHVVKFINICNKIYV